MSNSLRNILEISGGCFEETRVSPKYVYFSELLYRGVSGGMHKNCTRDDKRAIAQDGFSRCNAP